MPREVLPCSYRIDTLATASTLISPRPIEEEPLIGTTLDLEE
jgi:hypothetical protein